MTKEIAAIGTIGVLIASNFFGLIYSMLVLKTSVFKSFRIQSKAYKEGVFGSRMPLYLFNFVVLLIFSGTGAYFMFDFFATEGTAWWLIALQVLIAFIADDIWFYFMHRFMHENKFMLKNIHSIQNSSKKYTGTQKALSQKSFLPNILHWSQWFASAYKKSIYSRILRSNPLITISS